MAAGFADFTPYHSLAGGLMMAASLHTLLSKLGLVLGISGFFHSTVASALPTAKPKHPFRISTPSSTSSILPVAARYFTSGIFIGGIVLGFARSQVEAGLGVTILDSISTAKHASLLHVAALGALVGLGTKLGNGCTSGHFLCGLSRFSLRSLVATATFFGVAVVTHLSIASKAAARVSTVKTSLASHLPTSFPTPGPGTLLALQAPALVYLAIPWLLRTSSPSAAAERKRADQLLAAKIMALAVGVHFSFALGVSGMMRPSKVLGFLSLSPSLISSGAWDPSLAMVAVGGIIPASVAYFAQVKPKQDKLRRSTTPNSASKTADKPDSHLRPELSLVASEWTTPADPFEIDARLIIGSILFGLGWGATGLCPGPALVSLSSVGTQAVVGNALANVSELLVFVASMAVGGQLAV